MKHQIHAAARSATRRRRTQRRIGTALAVLGLVASACGASGGATDTTAAAPAEVRDLEQEVAATEVPDVEPVTTTTEVPDVEPVTTTTVETAEPESQPAASALTSGEVSGNCAYAFVGQIDVGAVLDQSCRISPENSSALPDEFGQQFIQFAAVQGTATPAGGATVVAGGSDGAFVLAGTVLADTARLVAVTRGVREFEGSTVHVVVFSPASPDGRFTMDWFVGDEAPLDPIVDETSAMVEFECTLAGGAESCTYEGNDDRFVPGDDDRTLATIVPDGVTDPIDGVSIFTSAAPDGAFRAGLDDENGLRRFVGLREGTGEFEGGLIAEEGWGQLDGNTFIGTMRLTVLSD